MKCFLDDNEAVDSLEFECGNNVEYSITANLCQFHFEEQEKLGYGFEEKYGLKIEELLHSKWY